MKIIPHAVNGWTFDIYDLEGTDFEKLLYFNQDELHSKLKETAERVDVTWRLYTESGERFGTNYERAHPDPSYLYWKALEELDVINRILIYKQLNQSRFYHFALDKETVARLTPDLVNTIVADPELTYIDLLVLYSDYEAELIIEDMIEKGELARKRIDEKREKWIIHELPR